MASLARLQEYSANSLMYSPCLQSSYARFWHSMMAVLAFHSASQKLASYSDVGCTEPREKTQLALLGDFRALCVVIRSGERALEMRTHCPHSWPHTYLPTQSNWVYGVGTLHPLIVHGLINFQPFIIPLKQGITIYKNSYVVSYHS